MVYFSFQACKNNGQLRAQRDGIRSRRPIHPQRSRLGHADEVRRDAGKSLGKKHFAAQGRAGKSRMPPLGTGRGKTKLTQVGAKVNGARHRGQVSQVRSG